MPGPLFRRHPLALGGLLIVLAYLASAALVMDWPTNFKAWREVVVDLSGILLMAAMAAAALLALRPVALEPRLGGLDRLYGLHKALGIAVCVLLGVHWLAELSPKILVALDLMAPKVKGPKPEGPVSLIASLRGPGKSFGEWTAWGMLALLPLALWGKAIAYGLWRHVHKLFGVALIAGVIHSALLTPVALWLTPVGVLIALTLVLALVAGVSSLAGRIGAKRKLSGHVIAAERLNSHTLELNCQLDGHWPRHAAGQFAFLTLDGKEGAHPYTIASADQGDGRIRFVIKALGDHTRDLMASARSGQAVTVEGPYGQFHLPSHAGAQVWVAGGIGITPFMAWLDELDSRGETRANVDFFWCVSRPEDAVRLDWMRERAAACGVRLHLLDSARKEFLGAEHPIFKKELASTQVWFCGPAGFAKALSQGLVARGLPPGAFHTEAFGFR